MEMTAVTLGGLGIPEYIDIVRDLRHNGYIQNVDYEWEVINSVDPETPRYRKCVFRFADPRNATYFALKYSDHVEK